MMCITLINLLTSYWKDNIKLMVVKNNFPTLLVTNYCLFRIIVIYVKGIIAYNYHQSHKKLSEKYPEAKLSKNGMLIKVWWNNNNNSYDGGSKKERRTVISKMQQKWCFISFYQKYVDILTLLPSNNLFCPIKKHYTFNTIWPSSGKKMMLYEEARRKNI